MEMLRAHVAGEQPRGLVSDVSEPNHSPPALQLTVRENSPLCRGRLHRNAAPNPRLASLHPPVPTGDSHTLPHSAKAQPRRGIHGHVCTKPHAPRGPEPLWPLLQHPVHGARQQEQALQHLPQRECPFPVSTGKPGLPHVTSSPQRPRHSPRSPTHTANSHVPKQRLDVSPHQHFPQPRGLAPLSCGATLMSLSRPRPVGQPTLWAGLQIYPESSHSTPLGGCLRI